MGGFHAASAFFFVGTKPPADGISACGFSVALDEADVLAPVGGICCVVSMGQDDAANAVSHR